MELAPGFFACVIGAIVGALVLGIAFKWRPRRANSSLAARSEQTQSYIVPRDNSNADAPCYTVEVWNPRTSVDVRGTMENFAPRSGDLSNVYVPLEGAVRSMPVIQQALERGKLFRIAGPPEAINEMGNSVRLAQSKNGNSIGLFFKDGKRGVFRHAEWKRMGVVTPATTFQLLSIATSQYYLVTITRKLDHVLRNTDKILARMRARAWGQLRSAEETLDELAAQLDVVRVPDSEVDSRLANAEQSIGSVLKEAQENLEQLLEEIRKVRESRGTGPRCDDVLDDAEKQLVADVELFRRSVLARVKWYQVALKHDAFTGSGAIDMRILRIRDTVDLLNRLQAGLDQGLDDLCEATRQAPRAGGLLSRGVNRLSERLTRTNERRLRRAMQLGCQLSAGHKPLLPCNDRALTFLGHQSEKGELIVQAVSGETVASCSPAA